MQLLERHCWAQVDVDALIHNYKIIEKSFKTPFYAVVKADAYGHGAKYVAKIYQDLDAFGFCVSSFAEALELRKAGIVKPILILGYTDPALSRELFVNNLTQTVFSYEYAKKLNDNSLYPIDCHIKLDTGMGRIGFDVMGDEQQALNDMEQLLQLHNLKFNGVFTHFAAADCVDERELLYTKKQIDVFNKTCKALKSMGFKFKLFHGQNSAGISRNLKSHFNLMRAGVILYGEQPSGQVIIPDIKPVMSLRSIVTHTKTVKAGQYIGYGMEFQAEKETRIATIACGYGDGLPRQLLHSEHYVYINNKSYKVLGKICMDQIMVDITDRDVCVGDEVIVLGGDQLASFENVASKVGTINYHLLCSIQKRVPRVYVKNNTIQYIETFI